MDLEDFQDSINKNLRNFYYLYLEEFNGCWPSTYPMALSFTEWQELFQIYLKANNKYEAIKKWGDDRRSKNKSPNVPDQITLSALTLATEIKLSDSERLEAIKSEQAEELCISAKIANSMLLITTADGEQYTISTGIFKPNPTATPDFSKLEIRDNGFTIAFGDYEVGTDCITTQGYCLNSPF